MKEKTIVHSTNPYAYCVYESLKKIHTQFIIAFKKRTSGEVIKKFDIGVEAGLNCACITLKNQAFVFHFSYEKMLDLKASLPFSVPMDSSFEKAPTESNYQGYLHDTILLLREALVDAIADREAKKDNFHTGYAYASYWVLQIFKEQAIRFGLLLPSIKLHEPISFPLFVDNMKQTKDINVTLGQDWNALIPEHQESLQKRWSREVEKFKEIKNILEGIHDKKTNQKQ